jgi:stage V sporulation protein G
VHNLKIISGKAGTFIAMPSRKTKTGEYKDIAHPINSDFRQKIQAQIIDEYDKVKDEPLEAQESVEPEEPDESGQPAGPEEEAEAADEQG